MKKDKMKLAGLLLAIACTSALGAGAVVASGTATGNNVVVQAEETSEYTTHTLGRLVMHANGGNAKSVYLKRADGGALPFEAWENPWVLESGDGLKVNGTKVSMGEMQSAKEGLYIRFDAVAEGDILTISGTFRCDKQKLKYVIEESSFKWNGTKWENATDYPDTETGKISIVERDSTAKAVYLLTTGNLPVKDWEAPCTYVSGNGITLNGTMISFNNSVKSVDVHTIYISLGTTAVEGDVLKVGGTIRNDKHGADIVLEDTEFVYNGTTWVLVEKEPEVVYTKHELGTLIANSNSNGTNAGATAATALYMSREDGVKLPYASWDAKFTLESGAWKLNGNDISLGNLVCAGEGLYIGLGSANVKAGDVLTVSGTFVWEAEKVKLVIAESSFIWTGSVWTKYAEPTTYEIGKLAIDGGSSATAVNFKKASGAAFEAKDGTWAEKLYFISGTGVGVTINGTQIKMNDIKIPNNMYVGLGTTAVEGDELVIGGTFFNGNLAVKYVVEESTFVFDGTAWAEKAEEAPAPEYNVVNVGTVAPYTGKSGTGRVYLQPADTTVTWSGASENFFYESGTGFKILRGEEVIEENKVQIANRNDNGDKDFYITTSATLQAGDKAVFGGTYYNEPNLMKYVFTDTEMWWNGTAWQLEKYEATPETYTEINVGKLVLGSQSNTAGSAHNQRIYTKSTGDALVTIDGVEEYTTTYVSGTQVLFNGEACAYSRSNVVGAGKYFYFKITIGGKEVGANVGDKVTIGGVFVNEEYKIKYTIEDTDFWWNGSTWQTEEYQEPAAPTVYEIGALAVHRNSDGNNPDNAPKATQLYMKRADGQALPYAPSTWNTKFAFESGDGWKINGNPVTFGSLVSTNAGLYVDVTAANVQPGDVLTVGGTFYCDSENAKYVITDTAFMWTGSIWTVYAEPTTYEIGKVAIDGGSKATAINFKKASGAAFEATDGTWAEKLYFISGTGVGVTINGTQINMSDIKIPNNMYVGLKTTAVAGDVLVIGGAFYNAKLAVKYVIEESTFTFDGENWVEVKPEVVYTTYTATKVGATRDSSATAVYLYALEGDAFPKDQASWDLVYTFETGSGAGLKLNDTALTTTDIKLPGDFFVALGATAQAGDILTIDGTYYNEEKAIKIAFVNCQVQFDGEKWGEVKQDEPEVPDVPVIEYTTYNITKIGVTGTQAAEAIYVYSPENEIPKDKGDWDNKYILEAGSGAGVTLNGTAVSEIKMPGDLYVVLGRMPVAGDILTFDGTIYNETKAIKLVFANLQLEFDGEKWGEVKEDEPEVEYTIHELGTVIANRNSNGTNASATAASCLYMSREDGLSLPYASWDAKFALESGAWKLNGNDISVGNLVCSNEGLYIGLSSANVQAGDILTVSGTFIWAAENAKLVIAESSFIWTGSVWTKYTTAPTTYEIGKLAIDGGSSATAVNFKKANGEAFEAKDGTWTEKLYFISGTGAGMTLNGTQINGKDFKIPNNIYLGLGTTAKAGDVLVIGGTFFNGTLAVQYVVEESTFVFDGTAWVAKDNDTPTEPELPEVEFTTYTITKIGVAGTQAAEALNIYTLEGDGLPKSEGDWSAVYTFAANSGKGVLLNGVALTGQIKMPGDLYVPLGKMPVAGDVLTIDGILYNEAKAHKFVFVNCQLEFDGEKWVEYTGSDTPDQPDTPVDPSGWTTVELGAVKVHKHSMEGGAGVGANKLYFTSSAAVEYPINSWSSRFTLESGDGWKLNGNAITVKEFISADKHLYITLAEAVQVGDKLTVSGTFSYADGKVQYVIEESTFIWNGTYWENYVEYTEYELGTLKFRMWTAGSNHIYLYGADDPRDGSIPKPGDGNDGWTATFKWKDGIGIQINGQNVSASVKYPGEIFIAFSKAPAVGDILTVGGMFYNDDLAIAYIVTETSFTWDGTTWVEVVDYTEYEVGALTTLGTQALAGSIDLKKADNGSFEANGSFKFLGGSGIGLAMNGEAIETKQIAILGNMMTFSIAPNANEGDVLTIGGTFYNVENAVKYIIEESSFIYENGTWSVYESIYNEIGLGEVIVLADASDAQYIYLASKDDTLELPVNSWEAEFVPTFGLGVTLNGQVVEGAVILSVDNSIYLELPSEAQDGDILVIGGKFVCEAEGVLYFVKNTQFTWNADEAAWEGVINYNTMEVGKLKLFGNSATATAGKSDRIHFKASSALVLEDFTLSLESGIGFTVNGEQREFTLKNLKDGSGYLYFTFEGVEEGDVVTIGGTFYNKEMAVKYVIEESTFIWENGAWSIIYEKVNVGPVIIITTTTSRQDLYLAPANGKTFPASGWEDPLYYVSGAGITVDGVEINMNNTVKVPDIGTIFVRLTGTADGVAEGAVVVIGGVFRCPTSGIEYTIEESTFVYANGAWSNQLDTVKSETVAALDEYFATFTEGDYYETEWTLLTEIVTTAKAAIKSEISKFAVEELFANAKANMDAVATKAAWDAESDQIKAQAKADIESYKNVNEYRDDDKAVIAATVAEALAGIDAATDWATMNNIVKHAKAVMDALWTAAEWDAAEAVVAAAKAELESYKSEADYFVEEWATIQTIIANANANIDALIGSTASIENVVKDAKAKMDAVKTMEQVIADEAVVNAAKDELAGYKAQADYNEPEWNEIQTILAKAYASIDEAIGDSEAIANIVADAKAKMDKVLKSEAANQKAFDDAKATAEAAIRELANSINYDEYSEEAANEISGYLAAAVEAIEAVTEKEDFAKIVDDVTAKIASVQKLAVADDNEVSILDKVKQAVGCSSVVGLTTSVTIMAAAAAIVLNKKKED